MSSFGLKTFYADSQVPISELYFNLVSLNPLAISTIDIPVLQQECAIAIGNHAGIYNQGTCAIAIGEYTGHTNQGMDAIAIGSEAGVFEQSEDAIAIGSGSGQTGQSSYTVAIGYHAGQLTQSSEAIAIGEFAGNVLQGVGSIAIGSGAGQTAQEANTIAIGYGAGQTAQKTGAIAIGYQAGQNVQKSNAIAVGIRAGQSGQSSYGVAIGYQAGQSGQSSYAIAIGYQAGQTGQPANSIVINASNVGLNSGYTNSCYMNPLRQISSGYNMHYEPVSKEVTYQLKPTVVGDIKYSAVSTNPHNGWLLCNGAAVSRVTYSELYAVVGTSFGIGDGVSTFNLPDARGRVLGAIGQGSGLTNRVLGATVGTETHTLTEGEMPSHNHTGTTDASPWGATVASPAISATTMDVADNAGTHVHTFTTNNKGGSLPHQNMQPTLFIGNVFIYSGVF